MPGPELTRPYRPNALLSEVYSRLFERIQVQEGWAETVRELSTKGSVLYVLPNLNWLDFTALDYLTKRHGLPPIRYANDLGLWVLNPDGPNVRGAGLINMLFPPKRKNPEAEFGDAIEHGGSAALFLKRPPSVLDVTSGASGGRGMQEGDELVHSIFRLEREQGRRLLLVPLVFVWSKSPDKLEASPVDFVLGSRTWPTPTRALWQLVYNLKHVSMRAAEHIDVGEFLSAHKDQSDAVLVRRITYMVLRRLERERRSMVGPAVKSPARIRSEILRSPRLQSVIDDLANKNEAARKGKTEEAGQMLAELQATPSPNVIKAMGIGLRWGFSRIYHGIDFDPADVERVRQASRDGALILLPSHKSHIDYLVLSYFFYEQNLPVPLIAAGDNLNFQPVGPIFRRAGAFFIRRSFKGDRLYAAVVDAYIRRLIRDGYPIELFLEGGRSRTGKLLEPKFGLLNMIVEAAIAVPQKKVHFVPLSIGYERVIEADSYQHELSGGEKKKEEAADLLSASDVLRHRYGRINLQFGSILTLGEICDDLGISSTDLGRPAKRRSAVMRLGNRVMDEINRVTAVTPGALTALALLTGGPQGLTEAEIVTRSRNVLTLLIRLGARTTSPTTLGGDHLRAASIREALQMFVDAELITEAGSSPSPGGTLYSIIEARRLQLDTSKNIIVHFFVERALVAGGFDRDATGAFLPTAEDKLKERVLAGSRLFKHEFRFRADAPFEEIFQLTVNAMVSDGHLERAGATLQPGPGELGWTGPDWLTLYRRILQSFFEGYAIAAESLSVLLGAPMTEKELTKSAITRGNQMYHEGRIERREAISKPIFQNALHAFVELGYLRARAGKLELVGPYQDLGALAEVAAGIQSFLSGHHEAPL